MKQILIWIGALTVGTVLGLLQIGAVDAAAGAVAAVYIRLFQLLSVPVIVLAVTTTLAGAGGGGGAGRIFRHAVTYTLLTTFAAAAVGGLLYVLIDPSRVPMAAGLHPASLTGEPETSFGDYLINVIPNNIVRPLLEGNVLSLLLLAAAVGIALARMAESDRKKVLMDGLLGLQDLLFALIRALIWTLPVGVVAFAAQLSAGLSAGVAADSLGRYVCVVLGGNLLQFFVVLPLFLLFRGLNPVHVLGRMMPAVLMALFTKSSAATLPVTMETAEQRLGVQPKVARFVLPVCTTVNMNGCAAFILVTSLFVMQQGGVTLTPGTVALWLVISVVSAIGNAGVPMGCYFLTFSLMTGVGAPVEVLGLILPIYTIIDMVETAVNVWSDSCVCAMTDKDIQKVHITQ